MTLFSRTAFSRAAIAAILVALACPALAAAADIVVPVHLNLYDGDRTTKAFSDALRQTVASDSRFTLTDPLPPEGVDIIMNDALKLSENEDMSVVSYEVTLKLGSGKFLKNLQGNCDQRRLAMCGRIVVEDAYTAYSVWAAGKK